MGADSARHAPAPSGVPHPGSVPGRGTLTACSGLAAVNRVESLICGPGAAATIATVRGAALAGGRAATLLSPSPPLHIGDASARLVHHRLAPDGGAAPSDLAFHLLAASAQEAVDHCLVAHLIAALLDRPGVCTIPRSMAESLHLVRIPDAATIRAVLDVVTAPQPEANLPDIAAVWQAATAACAAVNAVTDRPGVPLLGDGDDRELVIVTAGSAVRPVRAAIDALRTGGVACRLVTLALVHPVALEELGSALSGSETVVVAEPARAELGFALTWQVHAALGDGGDAAVHTLAASRDIDEFVAEIAGAARIDPRAGPAPVGLRATPNRVTVGISPRGAWGDAVLRDLAALVGRLGCFDLEPRSIRGASTLAMGAGLAAGDPADGLDLLVATRACELDPAGLLSDVRPGGTVVIGICEGSAAPPRLSRAALALLAERDIRVGWVDVRAQEGDELATANRTPVLLGAALVAAPGLATLVDGEHDLLRALSAVGDEGDPVEWQLVSQGAEALRWLDTEPSGGVAQTAPGVAEPHTPSMPVVVEPRVAELWLHALRHFHATGEGAHSSADPVGALPLVPAALATALTVEPSRHYPIVVPVAAGEAADTVGMPYAEMLEEAIARLEPTTGAAAVFERSGCALAAAGTDLVEHERGSLAEIFEAMATAVGGQLEDGADRDSALEAFAQLRGMLPLEASVIGLGSQTPLDLLIAAVRAERSRRVTEFREELGRLLAQLGELLQIDVNHDAGRAPEVLSTALGETAAAFFDVDVLAQALPEDLGSIPLGQPRRGHIEQLVETLTNYLEATSSVPVLVVFDSGSDPLEEVAAEGVELELHREGLATALGYFDGLVDDLLAVFRAVRAARMEVTESYIPERHDPVLDGMDWQSLTATELQVVPTIAVVETGVQLLSRSLASFSTLMRSGRPLQLLLLDTVDDEVRADLSENHLGIGYLAVAHREAFVQQATLARPRQLLAGLRRALGTLRPSVAVVACPAPTTTSPWQDLSVALRGRVTPSFCYDPSAGISWAERFDLSMNEDPEAAWSTCRVDFRDASAQTQTLDDHFTFAHAAAASSSCRGHFRVLPVQAWSAEQMAISEYLEQDPVTQLEHVPYLWVVLADGTLARALMTREMAHACLDRLQAWHVLQELAGTDSEYARRAAIEARRQAESAAQDEAVRTAAAHEQELEQVRAQTTSAAVARLAHALLGIDDGTPAPAIAAEDGLRMLADAAAGAVTDSTATSPPAVEARTSTPVGEAYIDSPLCTTCHDCINLNNRMFRYDDNKQAYLADPKAGTFAELVKAAEACPGRCIHPGAPPADDASVTPALIARAQKFG